jgi:hypothetical protein
MTRVYQEFYCNDCRGYFRVKLNMGLNIKVKMQCPECGRQHPRWIENGLIKDNYSRTMAGKPEHEVLVPKSAYSKQPKFGAKANSRDGHVITEDQQAGFLVKSLWQGVYGK